MRTLWGGIITEFPKMKICIPIWPSVVNCNIKEMVPCVTFSAKKIFWFVYTRLHSSVTGLHSFTLAKSLVCVFRIDPVQGWKRKHFVEQYFEAEIKQYALNRDKNKSEAWLWLNVLSKILQGISEGVAGRCSVKRVFLEIP